MQVSTEAEDHEEATAIAELLKKNFPKARLAAARIGGDVFYRDNMGTAVGMKKSLELDAVYLGPVLKYAPEPLKSVLQMAVTMFLEEMKVQPTVDMREFARRSAFGLKQQLILVRKMASRVRDGSRLTPTQKMLLKCFHAGSDRQIEVKAIVQSTDPEQEEEDCLLTTPLPKKQTQRSPHFSRSKSAARSTPKIAVVESTDVQIERFDRQSFVFVRRDSGERTADFFKMPRDRMQEPAKQAAIQSTPTVTQSSTQAAVQSPAFFDEHTGAMAKMVNGVKMIAEMRAGPAGFCLAKWVDGTEQATEVPNIALPAAASEDKAQGEVQIGKAKAKGKAKEKGKAKAKGKVKKNQQAKGNKAKPSQETNDANPECQAKAEEPVIRRKRLLCKTAEVKSDEDKIEPAVGEIPDEMINGWRIITRLRKKGQQIGKSYSEWVAPNGKRLRSLKDAKELGFKSA
jgi:hypothetical protein